MTNFTVTNIKGNLSEIARFNIEESGLISRYIHSKFIEKNLFRFVKTDAEFRQTYKIRRSAFAWRIFSGIGYGLPTSSLDSNNFYLPFFKQYVAGGANSMRGWGLRRLGPGSSIKSFARNVAPDRFGDIQLELNGEYRFYLANIQGVLLNSAVFTDMGNVWFLRKNPDFPDGEFRFNKLWKDIAIDVGTGLRIDFGLFLVRLDYAYKAKNPSPDEADRAGQNKWFYHWKWNGGQLQLGVNYPF
jgi:outer membrane protein assembly factor BamA